jgi:hypothetical protein
MRAAFARTVSASAGPPDHGNQTQGKSDMVTPGVTSRILSSAGTSTARRLGNLSRFGPPQRFRREPGVEEEALAMSEQESPEQKGKCSYK